MLASRLRVFFATHTSVKGVNCTVCGCGIACASQFVSASSIVSVSSIATASASSIATASNITSASKSIVWLALLIKSCAISML